jgi:predicted membrane protein
VKTGAARSRLPSLLAGLTIMIVGTLYPPMFTDSAGHADHGLALLLLCAMSAGLVRGVGFVPRSPVWRWVFSGWTCGVALVLGAVRMWLH